MKKNYDCDDCILEFAINGAFIKLFCLPCSMHSFVGSGTLAQNTNYLRDLTCYKENIKCQSS